MKKFLLIILGLVIVVIVSATTSYFVTRSQGYVRFVPEPREDNPDYGYLEIKGKQYYQLYTTTEIEDENTPPGSHVHAIDIRGKE